MVTNKIMLSGLVFVIFLSFIIVMPVMGKEIPLRTIELDVSTEMDKEVVQLRQLAEKLGWNLLYLPQEKAVNIYYSGRETKLEIFAAQYGDKKLEFVPHIKEGRVYIGLEMINLLLESLNMEGVDLLTDLKAAGKIYQPDSKLDIQLNIYNLSQKKIVLNFNSGQLYDLYLMKGGQEFWRWSKDKFFTMVLENKELTPGDKLSYHIELPTELNLTPGEYSLEAELKTAIPIKIAAETIIVK